MVLVNYNHVPIVTFKIFCLTFKIDLVTNKKKFLLCLHVLETYFFLNTELFFIKNIKLLIISADLPMIAPTAGLNVMLEASKISTM